MIELVVLLIAVACAPGMLYKMWAGAQRQNEHTVPTLGALTARAWAFVVLTWAFVVPAVTVTSTQVWALMVASWAFAVASWAFVAPAFAVAGYLCKRSFAYAWVPTEDEKPAIFRTTKVTAYIAPVDAAPAYTGATKMLDVVESGPDVGPIAPEKWLGWLAKQPHIILAAETGGGKSTTAKAILAGEIERGAEIYVIDPHSSNWFGLRGVGGGEDWDAVATGTRMVLDEYNQRLMARDAYLMENGEEMPVSCFPRLVVLFDEANNAKAAYDRLYKGRTDNPWVEFIKVLGSGARKVNISVILLVQSANVEDLGISGGLRNNFTRIALDNSNIRRMVSTETPARKRAIEDKIAGMTFPATTVMDGETYLLSREGLNAVAKPQHAAAALWGGTAEPVVTTEPVRPSVRPSEHQNKAQSDDLRLLNALLRTDGRTDGRTDAAPPPPTAVDMPALLRQMRSAGKSREEARALLVDQGLTFTNSLWTAAK